MELAIIGVHHVVVRSVFLPNLSRFNSMKSKRVFLIEFLHPGNYKNTFEGVFEFIVPYTGTTLFHCLGNQIYINFMLADIVHQFYQQNLIDTWKDFRIKEIRYLHIFMVIESMWKIQFVLNSRGNIKNVF